MFFLPESHPAMPRKVMPYKGLVDIVGRQKGAGKPVITLRKNPQGKWSAQDALSVWRRMREANRQNKYKYAIKVYAPHGKNLKYVAPIILQDRYGAPYMALLPKQKPLPNYEVF